MRKIKEIIVPGYEKVIEIEDRAVGLHGFIAIHNTQLGPAMGGLRIYPYANQKEALNDALRLSKAMTYKSALAEIGFGGGKSVLMADPKRDKTPEFLLSFAEALNTLGGQYIAAEDIGSTIDDMVVMHAKTPYVAALPSETSSGDPGRFTAWGVYQGMRAVAKKLWKEECLRKKIIAIQGLGSVGSKLANILFWEGANLIVCDKDGKVAHEHALLYGAHVVSPEQYLEVNCDLLAPCALGGVLNEQSIPRLCCKAVAGSANNQLLEADNGRDLMRRGILYAPDYVINAGGIINASVEFDSKGYDPKIARDKVNHIYDTLLMIFEKAEREHQPTNAIADQLAEHNLARGVSKRIRPIIFEKRCP
ncbi:MAG: Glu/Leu/Phe/Val dehydrogenase [Chlamydiales bacterium]